MFLLQIVMVSPGTHLVKIHESLSITNDSQFKKTRSPKLKMLGCLCNQTLHLETDAKTLYYMHSLLKLKYSTSVYIFKAQKRLQKLICIFKHPTATVITQTGYSTKKSSNRSNVLLVFPATYFMKKKKTGWG